MADSDPVLVFHHAGDESVTWLRDIVFNGTEASLVAVTSEALFGNLSYFHCISDVSDNFSIKLYDGNNITEDAFSLVINRLMGVSPLLYKAIVRADVPYSISELGAAYLAMFSSFRCPVINCPRGPGLSLSWRSELDWLLLASRVGLALDERLIEHPLEQNSAYDTAIVLFNSQVYGVRISDQLVESLRLFCAEADVDLFAVKLVERRGGIFAYAGVDLCPMLSTGGAGLVGDLRRKRLQ